MTGSKAFKISRSYRKCRLLSPTSLVVIAFMVYVIGCFWTLCILHVTEGSAYTTFGLLHHPLGRRILQEQGASSSISLTPPSQVASPRIVKAVERPKVASWEQLCHGITVDEMYPRSAHYMPQLLHDLSTERIVNVTVFKGGTQIKFLLKFADGNEAIAKPKRHPRDFYWGYNRWQPFWYDDERHTAEIASFHLDRILDYRRVPPCVGRKVNFSAEILQNSNDSGIYSTLRKQNGSHCFIGNCVEWRCNEDHPICDDNGVMELSVCQKIPWPIHDIENPWSQGIREAKVWKNKNVCPALLNDTKNLRGRYFLDVIENALFDHLIVNYDRHHIAKLGMIDKDRSFAAIIDNGKGFGNPFKDDITFLAPVYQCCRFRNRTYQHIISLTKEGNKLGDLMKSSLANDPLAPLLTDAFFVALDRRLTQFVHVMEKCIKRLGPETVLVNGLAIKK